jgi:type VII secretion-associated serine protease mycosin
MRAKRVWSTTGVVALTGALLLTSAPTASADYVRDQQWVLDAYKMDETWALTQGEGVTVAVVDSGVDGSHPDLTGQVLQGKDFTGGGNAQEDVAGHGTGMASLIAGHGHGAGNKAGMVGLAPKAKILPLRVLQNKDDDFEDDTWAEAVRYAVDNGAKVINLSLGGGTGSRTLPSGREAIAYAQAHDVVVVAAAGNEGGLTIAEPAALPGVVSVGAVDSAGNLWDKSNIGKGLTLVAPGVDIVSANPNRSDGYSLDSGTSDATAYVSAAAALVRAKFPDLTAGQVINRLIKSASFLHHKGLKAPDREYGFGILRPNKALTMDIPAGLEKNPLGQIPSSSSTSSQSAKGADSSTQAKKRFSSSNFLVLAGGITAVVIGAIAFVVIRSRRNGGPSSGGGTPLAGTSYPPQPPTGYQQYPNTPHSQGYPTSPGQPPHQGQ